MGTTAARAFVMLATVAVGNTAAGMAAKLPTLPGAGQAVVMAERQFGTHYGLHAMAHVESVALTAEGITITLASNAVAMASHGTGDDERSVYRSLNSKGQVQYVGITNDLARRTAEHLRQNGFAIDELLGGLSKDDARAVEQVLIEIYGLGKNGGTLLNRINSIAHTSPKYSERVRRGQELLKTIGYQVE